MVDKQETDIYALGMSFLKIRCDSFSKELSENCNLQNRNKKIETLLIKFVQQFEKEQELMDSVHEMVYQGINVNIRIRLNIVLEAKRNFRLDAEEKGRRETERFRNDCMRAK